MMMATSLSISLSSRALEGLLPAHRLLLGRHLQQQSTLIIIIIAATIKSTQVKM